MQYSSEKIALWEWYDIESTSSTNDEIKKRAKENAAPIVVSAQRQIGGRGRRGRKWQGVDGNLYFTYSLDIAPEELSKMVCLVGLSLAKTTQQLAPHKQVQIKWPNDVFLQGGKLSGILFENITGQLWGIGIGVNIVGAPQLENQPYKAVSLKECSILLDRTEFLRYYLQNFASDLTEYQKNGFALIKKQWLNMALNYRQKITVKTEKDEKTGIFAALDDNGYLILQTQTGEERILAGDLFV